jgi:hypothetical protein
MELISDKEASKIRLRDAKIYVHANESSVHKEAVWQISADISRSSNGHLKYIIKTYSML